jgi:hypothetical protein
MQHLIADSKLPGEVKSVLTGLRIGCCMQPRRSIACGRDIHNDFLVAAIVYRNGSVMVKRFNHTRDGQLLLKSWIVQAECPVVAMESTGNWRPVSITREGYVG